MKKNVTSDDSSQIKLSYQLLRNTTSPDEISTGVRSFVLNLSAREILKLGTDDNLRAYIAEDNPRKRNRVHDAIRNTIETAPQRFISRNSGFAVTATDIDVDDKAKKVTLTDPSIINGAQSQGEIRRWFEDQSEEDDLEDTDEAPFFVRVEIIVDADPQEVVETAIARNTATPVKSVSQAAKRGHLDDLQRSIKARLPDLTIRMSETDEGVFDTVRILQYARLLMPRSVSKNDTAAEQLRPYKNAAYCLKDFSTWFENKDTDPEAKELYDFMVQIAPSAIEEYRYWEDHDCWNGHKLHEKTTKGRACRRDRKSGTIVWVAPGLVFPILCAMSEFVALDEAGKWSIIKPSQFEPAKMIEQATKQFRAHGSDTSQMGRSAAAYEALRTYPETLMTVLRDVGAKAATVV